MAEVVESDLTHPARRSACLNRFLTFVRSSGNPRRGWGENEVMVGLEGGGLEVALELACQPVGERHRANTRRDFGPENAPRTWERLTRTLPAAQSTSSQRSAISSPWRRPAIAAVRKIGARDGANSSLRSASEAITASSSSGLRKRMSGSAFSRGRSTCSQGFPLPHPRFLANLKIEWRKLRAFPIVFGDLPSAAFAATNPATSETVIESSERARKYGSQPARIRLRGSPSRSSGAPGSRWLCLQGGALPSPLRSRSLALAQEKSAEVRQPNESPATGGTSAAGLVRTRSRCQNREKQSRLRGPRLVKTAGIAYGGGPGGENPQPQGASCPRALSSSRSRSS